MTIRVGKTVNNILSCVVDNSLQGGVTHISVALLCLLKQGIKENAWTDEEAINILKRLGDKAEEALNMLEFEVIH